MNDIPENLESGTYYWGKSEQYKWFNLIIYVSGDSPFLRLEVWDRGNSKLYLDYEYWKVAEWGSKIENPND